MATSGQVSRREKRRRDREVRKEEMLKVCKECKKVDCDRGGNATSCDSVEH